MYEPEDEYMHEDEEAEEIPTEMWQESSWITISAFFEEKGKHKRTSAKVKSFQLVSHDCS